MKKAISIVAVSAVLLASINLANNYIKEQKYCSYCPAGHHFQHRIHQKRQQFIQKLNLNEEQIKKADELFEKGKKQMHSIAKEYHYQKSKLIDMIDDNITTKEFNEQKEKVKALRNNLQTIRDSHKREFESILTNEQKIKLEEIKQEKIKKLKLLKEVGIEHNFKHF